MTLGEKISFLRKKQGYTQAELGNVLGVTYQAVSKWERNDSMPDFDMISKLAKLFGVPISYFEHSGEVDENNSEHHFVDDEVKEAANDTATTSVKQALGTCTVCGRYVYEDNVGEETPKLVCSACHAERVAQAQRDEADRQQKIEMDDRALSARFKKRVIWATVVAAIIGLAALIVGLIELKDYGAGMIIAYVVACLVMSLWIFQLFFDGVVRDVTLAGLYVIKLPGIIFSASLDGLIFLVVMKILFFIISAVVFVGAIIITSLAAMFVSIFTFIPLIFKIKRKDEDIL